MPNRSAQENLDRAADRLEALARWPGKLFDLHGAGPRHDDGLEYDGAHAADVKRQAGRGLTGAILRPKKRCFGCHKKLPRKLVGDYCEPCTKNRT